MNIIFLDFDGVLNSEEFYFESPSFKHGFDLQKALKIFSRTPELLIDPNLLGHVKDLCSKLDASVVISSSWRFHYGKCDFIRMFDYHGWSNAPIIDVTKDLRSEHKSRGDEVQLWLDTHNVDNYVIIDDVDDFHPEQNIFITDCKDGLAKKYIHQIVTKMQSCYAIPSPH